MLKLSIAAIVGSAIATLAAVTLGDYPLTGAVPWLAAAIVPAAIGVAMNSIARRNRRALWVATGLLSGACLAWGVRIASGWGLDPIPPAAWAEIAIGLVWPVAWGLASGRAPGRDRPAAPATPT